MGASGSSSAGTAGVGGMPSGVQEVVEIADVWSGHPVNFSLLTLGDRQFAAFYAADRRMTVATRTLGSQTWQQVTLPTTLGWDSHNHVVIAADGDGRLHVAGNMHNVPLIYFRTSTPLDVASFARITSMVGTNEGSVTYPEFFRGPGGELIFAYRDGGSGNGNHVFDVYAESTETWSRLLDTPLTNGEGLRATPIPSGRFGAPTARSTWSGCGATRRTPRPTTICRMRRAPTFRTGSAPMARL
jgi:hypothetical protein